MKEMMPIKYILSIFFLFFSLNTLPKNSPIEITFRAETENEAWASQGVPITLQEYSLIYDEGSYKPMLTQCKRMDTIRTALRKLQGLYNNDLLYLSPSYTTIISHARPTSCDVEKSTITLNCRRHRFLNPETFNEQMITCILMSALERGLKNQPDINLTTFEKIRLVDLYCMRLLSEELPNFNENPKGNHNLDTYFDASTLRNNPLESLRSYSEKQAHSE